MWVAPFLESQSSTVFNAYAGAATEERNRKASESRHPSTKGDEEGVACTYLRDLVDREVLACDDAFEVSVRGVI